MDTFLVCKCGTIACVFWWILHFPEQLFRRIPLSNSFWYSRAIFSKNMFGRVLNTLLQSAYLSPGPHKLFSQKKRFHFQFYWKTAKDFHLWKFVISVTPFSVYSPGFISVAVFVNIKNYCLMVQFSPLLIWSSQLLVTKLCGNKSLKRNNINLFLKYTVLKNMKKRFFLRLRNFVLFPKQIIPFSSRSSLQLY